MLILCLVAEPCKDRKSADLHSKDVIPAPKRALSDADADEKMLVDRRDQRTAEMENRMAHLGDRLDNTNENMDAMAGLMRQLSIGSVSANLQANDLAVQLKLALATIRSDHQLIAAQVAQSEIKRKDAKTGSNM